MINLFEKTSSEIDFRKIFIKTIAFIFILLTIAILLRNNLLKPSIPTTQLYLLTKNRSILTTSDSFINFIINFRLVEAIVFTIITTVFFIDYLDSKKIFIITITKLSFIAIVLFNQIIVKNPYPTIPGLRKYLDINTIFLDYTAFLLLLVFLIIDLTILILTLYSTSKIIKINNIVKNTLLLLITIYLLTIITLDYVIAYIMLYIVFYTVTAFILVKKFD